MTLASTASPPSIGSPYFLRPGGSVFPSGLAGRVTAIVDGAAGRHVLTVTAAKPGEAFDLAKVRFDGTLRDLVPATATSRRGALRAADGPGSVRFGAIPASAFECHNNRGKSADLFGKVSVGFHDVRSHVLVNSGRRVSKPYVNIWVSYERTVGLELSTSREATCHLRALWQNTHKQLFIDPHTGISLSFAPDMRFTVSAGGAVRIAQHSWHMTGFATNSDGSIRQIKAHFAEPGSAEASGSLSVEAYAGVQVQVGLLDRIGAGISAGGGGNGTLEAATGPSRVCARITGFLRATLYAYLDVWVKKWSREGFEAILTLAKWEKCAARLIEVSFPGSYPPKARPDFATWTGDGTGYFGDMKWSTWTTAGSDGSGTVGINDCDPSCADGTFTYYPAQFHLSDPKPLRCGTFFMKVEVVYTADVPPHMPRVWIVPRWRLRAVSC